MLDYCGGRKSSSEEYWSLSEASTNAVNRKHSCANGYMSFSMVGEIEFQRFNGGCMWVSHYLFEIHVIPTKQEEEEGWYIFLAKLHFSPSKF